MKRPDKPCHAGRRQSSQPQISSPQERTPLTAWCWPASGLRTIGGQGAPVHVTSEAHVHACAPEGVTSSAECLAARTVDLHAHRTGRRGSQRRRAGLPRPAAEPYSSAACTRGHWSKPACSRCMAVSSLPAGIAAGPAPKAAPTHLQVAALPHAADGACVDGPARHRRLSQASEAAAQRSAAAALADAGWRPAPMWPVSVGPAAGAWRAQQQGCAPPRASWCG